MCSLEATYFENKECIKQQTKPTWDLICHTALPISKEREICPRKYPFVGDTGLHGCRSGEYKMLWGSTERRRCCWYEVKGLPVEIGWVTPPPTTGSLVGTAMNLPFFCQEPWSHICQILEAVKVKNTPTVSRTRGYYSAAMLQLVMLCCSHLLPPVLPPARPSPPHPSAVWHCWSVRGTASPWRWSMLAPQANNPSFFNMAGAQGQHRRRVFFLFFSGPSSSNKSQLLHIWRG